MNPSKHILVVEDHPNSAEVLSAALVRRGHTVTIALTATDALRLCREHPFDLLLCDIGLPDFSGLDLVRLVKQECPTLKVVAITGYGLPADTVIAAGFDAHLVKPVTFEQVLAHV